VGGFYGMLPTPAVVLPHDLDGVTNGRLPSDMLVSIGPSGRLHWHAAMAWFELSHWAASVGLPLTYTYGGTYRSYEQQETLFRQRYTTVPNGRESKTWNGVRWYLNPGVASAAVPGTSNHGWGLAVDVAYDGDTSDGVGPDDALGITSHPRWPDLVAVATSFGWGWEWSSETAEPWHIRYFKGVAPAIDPPEVAAQPLNVLEDDDMPAIAAIYTPAGEVVEKITNPKWFVLKGDGGIRHATNADVAYAKAKGVDFIEHTSADQYASLEAASNRG
jgi:hypothetical protein